MGPVSNIVLKKLNSRRAELSCPQMRVSSPGAELALIMGWWAEMEGRIYIIIYFQKSVEKGCFVLPGVGGISCCSLVK